MCGIVGIISKSTIAKNSIEPMTDTLIHRGPDGVGYYYNDNFIFGHRRLSIIDLSELGRQPMEYMDNYVITFNGEIYNYSELRNELEKNGYRFKSHTDTEVIMASYDFWGLDCLNKFNGMWAFVLYSKKKKQFLISRDRFGKKPFYYYKTSNTFIFASEIKAILAHPDVRIEPNTTFLDEYFFSSTKEYTKDTAFENIYRFDFSSYFEGTLDELMNDFRVSTFWKIEPNLSYESFDEKKAKEYAQTYYNLLEDAVRIRLRADVKVGSALSGGLDSSSIVYLVNKILKEQGKEELQETFSSIYKSQGTQECDESKYINIMSSQLSIHSNQIEPQENDIPNEMLKMIWHLENPPENSLMSSWHTFKLVASTNVKVTLDGQGADEQLAGYLSYLMHYISSLSFFDMLKEAKKCYFILNAKKYVLLGMCLGMYRIVFGENFLKYTIKRLLKRDFEVNLNQKLANDTMRDLVTLIHYAEHTSMAFSIESRMPFMDYRLVEFLASVPVSYKMRNGWTKYLARLAFDEKLPNEINWRVDKMGWPIPEKKWFLGALFPWLSESIQKSRLCKRYTNNIQNSKFNKKLKLLNISIWEKLFFKGSSQ